RGSHVRCRPLGPRGADGVARAGALRWRGANALRPAAPAPRHRLVAHRRHVPAVPVSCSPAVRPPAVAPEESRRLDGLRPLRVVRPSVPHAALLHARGMVARARAARSHPGGGTTRALRAPAGAFPGRGGAALAAAGVPRGDHAEELHGRFPTVRAPLLHEPGVLLVAPPVVSHLPLHVHHALPAAAGTPRAERCRRRDGSPAGAVRRDRAVRRRPARAALAVAGVPEPLRRLGELPLVLALLLRRLSYRPFPGRRRADRRRTAPVRRSLLRGHARYAAVARVARRSDPRTRDRVPALLAAERDRGRLWRRCGARLRPSSRDRGGRLVRLPARVGAPGIRPAPGSDRRPGGLAAAPR